MREFLAESAAHGMTIKVAVQDGSEGRDSGLVVVDLGNGGAEVYMQPASLDNTWWETTLTSRPGDLTLSPMKLAAIAAEVAVASDL